MIVRFVRSGIRLLPLAAIILLLVEMVVTNELAGYGKKVADADRAIDRLEEENQLLGEKVASFSSLLSIEEKALTLGFTTTPAVVPLGQESVAFQREP